MSGWDCGETNAPPSRTELGRPKLYYDCPGAFLRPFLSLRTPDLRGRQEAEKDVYMLVAGTCKGSRTTYLDVPRELRSQLMFRTLLA